MTVTGPVDAGRLGTVLMHEHVFINELREERAVGLLNDYELMKLELEAFKAAGGQTIVELTTSELTSGAAQDPAGLFSGVAGTGYAEEGTRAANQVLDLARLSHEVGLYIVAGAGHYRNPYLDEEWIERNSIDAIAQRIIADIEQGFASTGVRAGIIGEIASDKWHLSAAEERSFRAAARAQQATGLAISTHASRWPVGLAQLDVLAHEGADLRRVIIGHCDTVNIPEYHLAIAERGAFVQFDTIRGDNDFQTARRVEYVKSLVDKGHGTQILLSHDVCTKPHLRTYGGHGYTYVTGEFADRLARAGISGECIQTILDRNPAAALGVGQ
jgi:phosphotriesterase-related protein